MSQCKHRRRWRNRRVSRSLAQHCSPELSNQELSSRSLAVRPDLENRPESANSSHAPEKDARVPLDDIQSMIEFLK